MDRLPVDRLPYLLEAARRGEVAMIVVVREAETGAGPVIPRIPAAVGRILRYRELQDKEVEVANGVDG